MNQNKKSSARAISTTPISRQPGAVVASPHITPAATSKVPMADASFKEWVGDTNETDLDDEEDDETTSQAERKAKITSDPNNAEFQKCEDYASLYPFNEPFLIT